jgi:hypothetical protein
MGSGVPGEFSILKFEAGRLALEPVVRFTAVNLKSADDRFMESSKELFVNFLRPYFEFAERDVEISLHRKLCGHEMWIDLDQILRRHIELLHFFRNQRWSSRD